MTYSLKIIDGKKIAQKIEEKIKDRVAFLKEKHNQMPGLCCVLVGDNPESKIYISEKKKATQRLGFYFEEKEFPPNTSQGEVTDFLKTKNSDPKIHGIILQLPLPDTLDSVDLLKKIHPYKDVDGLHPKNIGLLVLGKPIFLPATTKAILKILEEVNFDCEGAEAVILGRSNLVGKPTAVSLINAGATVVVCRSTTKNLSHYTKRADLLISAVGKAGLVKEDMVKKGVGIIDVGITRVDGKIRGDAELDVAKKASFFTPVPGGVGPVTVACLIENTLLAFERELNL